MNKLISLSMIILALSLGACDKKEQAAAPAAETPAVAAEPAAQDAAPADAAAQEGAPAAEEAPAAAPAATN